MNDLTQPLLTQEEKTLLRLERIKRRKIHVSAKIRILWRELKRHQGSTKERIGIEKFLKQYILRYRLIWKLMMFCMKNRNTYFLTLSTPHFRGYSDAFVKSRFRTVLQRINSQLYGRNGEWALNGYAVIEKHDKQGDPVCPHVHAIVSIPDEFIEKLERNAGDLELLFRYAISSHYYQYKKSDGSICTKKCALEDTYSHPVFDDVELEIVRQTDQEDLCQYITKNVLHPELVSDPSDEGAGLFEVRGDSFKRIL